MDTDNRHIVMLQVKTPESAIKKNIISCRSERSRSRTSAITLNMTRMPDPSSRAISVFHLVVWPDKAIIEFFDVNINN
jgi:hypothetical protein